MHAVGGINCTEVAGVIMAPATRSHAHVFTINNYTEADIEAVKNVDCVGMKAGFEIGAQGTPHIQGAVYWGQNHAKTCSAAGKALGKRAHCQPMFGSWEDQKYCLKDGDILRNDGNGPEQGSRNDITGMKRRIDEGASLLDLYEEDFKTTAKYSKAFKEYMDLKARKTRRTEMTTCTWYWGESGVGKSHRAFNSVDLDDTFVWKNDNGWWDGYTGQTNVIINEFRGEIPYGELLTMIDKWPHSVRRRSREPHPFTSNHIIITSALPPDQIYYKLAARDSIKQLLRRVEVIEVSGE